MIDSISNTGAEDLKKARRRKSTTVGTIDRLPPHSIEAERGVLGCCLISPNDCIDEVISRVKTIGFYDLRHETIMECLIAMRDRMEEIDIITVQQKLRDKQLLDQIGGIAYLSQLQDVVPSAANLSYYLEIIRDKFLLRKMISICTDVVGRVHDYEGEVDALMDEVERDIMAIRPKFSAEGSDIKSLVHEAIDRIEQRCMSSGIMGLSTGIPDLDRLTDGVHPGEMVVVAALPSRGKTAIAVNIAVHNALQGIPCAILSAEMRPVQLIVRSICSEARVNYRHVCDRDFPAMTAAAKAIANSPLFIERASGFTIGQVRSLGRRLKQKHGIKLMVIDYLQLISGEGDTKEQEVSSISKGVKSLGLELDIPIILLSQLNKDGMTKYAAATSEDADGLWKVENDGEWQPKIQPINLNVEKCRDGETGSVPLTFFKEFTRIEQASKFEGDDIPKRK